MVGQDRREEGVREGRRDRRMIARFSDPRIATNFQQVKVWVSVLLWLFFGAGLFELSYGIWVGPPAIGPSILLCVIFWFICGFFYRYLDSLRLYLENESVNNLNTMVERLNTILLAFSVFGACAYIGSFFYRF